MVVIARLLDDPHLAFLGRRRSGVVRILSLPGCNEGHHVGMRGLTDVAYNDAGGKYC